MITQVSPQPRIGPSQVRRRGGTLVLVTDELDHVVPLSGIVRLDEPVLDEVVPELGIVPSGKDGRLGLVVVVLQERFVLFTLQVGGRVGAANEMARFSRQDLSSSARMGHHDTHMIPSETNQSLIWKSDQVVQTLSLASQ